MSDSLTGVTPSHGSQADPSSVPEPMPEEPRPPGMLRIGRLAGSDVLVSPSWFLVAAVIALLLAPRVEMVQPGLGAWAYVAGLAFAVVLYLSVLLHEASHAFVARHYGYRISSITLHFLGGATTIDGEARTPRQEFWIAIVGPLTSLAVGLVGVGLWFITPDGLLLLGVQALAGANLIVGILNLVPGLPLDGGRVLKAVVWGVSGSAHQGTIVAAWGGRVAAVAVLFWPLLIARVFDTEPSIFDFVLATVIAIFLWTAATAAMANARLRRKLPGLVAGELARRTLAVPDDLPLAEAVRRAQEAHAGSLVTVTGSGAPIGVVSEAALQATPPERRPWLPVSTVARTLEDDLRLPAGIRGEELIKAITRRPASEYLLVDDDGGIVGVLATSDVDRAFRDAR